MNQGGICIGCTMPGFPDKFAPFYASPPGSFVSSTTASTIGTVMRFMRTFTKNSLNRAPLWDKTNQLPSGWALERRPEPFLERFVHFFYRKRQLINSIEPGRTVPETKFRDGWEVPTLDEGNRGGVGGYGEIPGQARRLAKVARDAAAGAAGSGS